MTIESPEKTVSYTPEKVYAFLMEPKNFEKLMPENTKFELINDKRFLFALKGMPEIILDLKEGIPYSKVTLGAASDKLPFTLTADIKQYGADESEVKLLFDGEFNPMMSMMIKKPITKFIDTLITNLKEVSQKD